MKGDEWRQEQPRAGQNGDHAGRQMKAGAWRSQRETNEGRQTKAGVAKSRPEWRSRRGTNEGRQMKAGAEGDKWRQERPRAGQNGDHAGRQMNGDHAGRQMKAGAAKSRPEWRSQRETNEGRLGGSGRDFGDQQPKLWEVRTPNSFQLSGEKIGFCKVRWACASVKGHAPKI